MDTSLSSRPNSDWKSKYFGKEILALKFVGLSLSGNESTAYKIYSFTLITATVFLYPILDFGEFFKHEFNEVADSVVYQVGGVLTFCKVVVVYRNRVSFANLLAKLERAPFLVNPKRGGDTEQELIDECVWITNLQTYTYWITTCIIAGGAMIYTYTKRLKSSDYHDWQFPFGELTLLNITYSPNYDISYFYQCISIAYIGCHFSSIDLILAGILAHTCYQFKILQNHIRHAVELGYEEMMQDTTEFEPKSAHLKSNTETDVSTIPWPYLKNSLKKAIKYHLAIINIVSEMEESFSGLFLVLFLGTLALLCFSVYIATMFQDDPQVLAGHIGAAFCASLQVVTVCFWGEQVRHESQEVGRAALESNFVGTDVRFQKMLVLIIRRSQKPVKVTAGKFAEICLVTFVWILRASYSAFMLLRKANA